MARIARELIPVLASFALMLCACMRAATAELVYYKRVLDHNATVTIRAFNGSHYYDMQPGYYDTTGQKYIIGRPNAETKITFWEPFAATDGGGAGIHSMLVQAAAEYVISTRDRQGRDTVWIEIVNVGWGGVGGTRVCGPTREERQCIEKRTGQKLAEYSCPDLMMIGTTQVAARVQLEELQDLTDYFGEYMLSNGMAMSDDFVRQYMYEFYYSGKWFAVPIISDTRILFYNRTTFDKLGLKYPPPAGDWSMPLRESWTWQKLADYAKIIKDSGLGYGFTFRTCWDEEFKLAMMMAHDSRSMLLKSNSHTQCGFDNERFKTFFEETIYRMFVKDKSGDPGLFTEGANWAKFLYNDSISTPTREFTYDCCRCDKSSFIGMTLETTAARDLFPQPIFDPVHSSFPNASIGLAYVPGMGSFLGGSGLALTSGGDSQRDAWELLKILVDSTRPYIHEIAFSAGSPPPYESALDMDPWNGWQWATQRYMLKHAVPPQYPRASLAEMGTLENRKPFRKMFGEALLKGVEPSLAITRACDFVESLLRPECDDHLYPREDGKCVPCNEIPESELADLPERLYCPLMRDCNRQSISQSDPKLFRLVISCSGLLACVSALIGVIITVFKRNPAVRKGSYPLLMMMLVGACMNYAAVFLLAWEPSTFTCQASNWLLHLSFPVAFGSLFLKTWRIIRIFSGVSGLNVISIPDSVLIVILMAMTFVYAWLLAVWAVLDPVKPRDRLIDLKDLRVWCSSESPWWGYGTLIADAIILLVGVYLCIRIRVANVRSDFNEGAQIAVSIYFLFVMGCLVFFISEGIQDTFNMYFLIVTLGLLFATTTVIAVIFAPKLYFIRYPEEMGADGRNTSSNQSKSYMDDSANRQRERSSRVSSLSHTQPVTMRGATTVIEEDPIVVCDKPRNSGVRARSTTSSHHKTLSLGNSITPTTPIVSVNVNSVSAVHGGGAASSSSAPPSSSTATASAPISPPASPTVSPATSMVMVQPANSSKQSPRSTSS